MKKQKTIWMILGVLLCFGLSIVPVIKTQAVKKTTLKKITISKKTANVIEKKKITLSVKNPTQKVIWKSSNKKVAIVKSTSSVKKSKAVIQGKKKGNCTITAKIGKKTLKCKLKVYAVSAKDPLENPSSVVTQGAIGVYVTNVAATRDAISVTVKYFNGSKDAKESAYYGYVFSLQKWVDNQWKTVETKEPMYFILPAIILEAQKEGEMTYSLKGPKEDLTSGKYRIDTSLSAGGKTPCDPYAEFYLNLN